MDAGGQYETVTVTYTVQDYVYKDNAIEIKLPSGWAPHGGNAATDGYGTALALVTGRTDQWTSLGTNAMATSSYIEVRANFRSRGTGTPTYS